MPHFYGPDSVLWSAPGSGMTQQVGVYGSDSCSTQLVFKDTKPYFTQLNVILAPLSFSHYLWHSLSSESEQPEGNGFVWDCFLSLI